MSDFTSPKAFENQEPEKEIDLAKVHGSILREHNEPAEGYEPVPLWLVSLVMILVFWGGVYLAYYSGGFRADTFNPRHEMVSIPNETATLGKRIYTQNCILCHQADGMGVPYVYPPLAGSEWVLARGWRGDNHLVNIVLHGLEGPVEVNGTTFNNTMPSWKFLRDDEIAAVLTYIRSQWNNSASPITAEFVKRSRERNVTYRGPWFPNELQAIAREVISPQSSALPVKVNAPVKKGSVNQEKYSESNLP